VTKLASSPTDLDRLSRATVRAWAAYATRAGGHAIVDDGITFIVGAHPSPIIVNTAFRTDPGVDAGIVVERSLELYGGLGHGFALVTSDHGDADLAEAAATAGLTRVLDLPAMVCRARIPDHALPAGIDVRRADPERDIQTYRWLVTNGFASDDDEREVTEHVFGTAAALADPATVGIIATLDGEPAAVAQVDVVDRLAYVGWVGTVPELRRRGLGQVVTRAVTNAGFDLGADIAGLEASSMGLSLYERLGYETIGLDSLWMKVD
jgi:ribosomal protein S18 acetylase RimI-like enzyme